MVSLIYHVLINSKIELRSHLFKGNKVKKYDNQVLVHTSVETIFSTNFYFKNCSYKFLANRYFKALPFKQHQNYVSVMMTPSCANISMHSCNNNVNYMYFKDSEV